MYSMLSCVFKGQGLGEGIDNMLTDGLSNSRDNSGSFLERELGNGLE